MDTYERYKKGECNCTKYMFLLDCEIDTLFGIFKDNEETNSNG